MRSCLLLMLACALSTSQADARKQIQAQYDRWSTAYMANDVDTLLDILSPEYTLTNTNKEVMTFAVYRAYLNLRKRGPVDTTKYSTRIRKLVLHGQDAEIDSIESMVTLKSGKTTVHRHEYLDKWRRAGDVWKLRSTVTIKESTTKG